MKSVEPPAPAKGDGKPKGEAKRLKKNGEPAKTTGVKGGRPVGTESGVGVERTWCLIFEREAGKKKGFLTDAEITAEMERNFPGRGSDVFRRVSTVRGKFNRGAFSCQDGEPAKKAESHNKTTSKKG